MNDRCYDNEVEQRLSIEERWTKRRPIDDAIQRRAGGERECARDEQRCDERQSGVGVFPREHCRDENRGRHGEPTEVDPPQNPVRVQNRLATRVVGAGDGAHRIGALQFALE